MVVLLIGAFFMMLPFFWMFAASMRPAGEAYQLPPNFFPDRINLESYDKLISGPIPFLRIYWNSFFVATMTTIGVIATSAMAAFAFSRMRFPGSEILFASMLLGLMVPPALVLIPLFYGLAALNLVDTVWALILPALASPLAVFMMRQFMQSQPREYEEAAFIDGASYWTIFRRNFVAANGSADRRAFDNRVHVKLEQFPASTCFRSLVRGDDFTCRRSFAHVRFWRHRPVDSHGVGHFGRHAFADRVFGCAALHCGKHCQYRSQEIGIDALLGSQAINLTGFISGLDIGVPEVFRFGFAHFRTAVATADTWNCHDGAEIVFLLNGEACWEIADDILVPLSGGQSAIFEAKLPHRITNGIYPPSSIFWIALSGPQRAENPALLTPDSCQTFYGELGTRGITHRTSDKCLESISTLARLMNEKHIYTGHDLPIAEMRAHLHLVLVETWKVHRLAQKPAKTNSLVERVLKLIHENGGIGLSISDLAQKQGCSRGNLSNEFRRVVGMPPSDYAIRLRIKESCRRLVAENDSITDIAYESGFSSSQHFARVFKRYVGLTPTGYRNQLQSIGLRR